MNFAPTTAQKRIIAFYEEDILQQQLLIALIPSCASQHELTAERPGVQRQVKKALAFLKAAGLIALVMVGDTAVWTLTPAGRKKARNLRDGAGEVGPAPRIEEQPNLL